MYWKKRFSLNQSETGFTASLWHQSRSVRCLINRTHIANNKFSLPMLGSTPWPRFTVHPPCNPLCPRVRTHKVGKAQGREGSRQPRQTWALRLTQPQGQARLQWHPRLQRRRRLQRHLRLQRRPRPQQLARLKGRARLQKADRGAQGSKAAQSRA
jgi:hypothetical protein